ncbi:nuclear transport factor 2 family protein [Streptomyces carpinensis]|uniref:Nuclear transport factor 2 family protein n=1 Tax=Streptomyces carpinensis TaxID=66369 RepID=A0ABV1VVT7_9ACTN|nr:nuclear transport factor 2 family protein [Streptomyces carpinensis]
MKVTSDNIQAVVQRLADEADIQRVIFDYAFHLDAADPEKMLPLFTDDLYVAYGPSHGAKGPEEYLEVLGNEKTGIAGFFAGTSHHVSNVAIDFVDEDTAKVRSVLLAWHRYNRERPDGIVYAQYHDVFKRTADGWKIQRREQLTTGTEQYHAKAHALVMAPRKNAKA